MQIIMSHAEFEAWILSQHKLTLKVTRSRVIIDKSKPLVKFPAMIEAQIDIFRKDDGLSLVDCAKTHKIIGGIKRIRCQSGLGLKDSKDIWDLNKEDWKLL